LEVKDMTTGMSEEEIYRQARKRVEEKKGFYVHFAVYIIVNIILVIIWAATGAGYPWFLFPLGGWGIGILFHFLGVFVFSRQTDWERRAVEKEAERLRKSGG
jgi:fatty acid desaturase